MYAPNLDIYLKAVLTIILFLIHMCTHFGLTISF